MPHEITDIWDGAIEYEEEGYYIVKNAGHNQDINVNQSVNFGFKAIHDGNVSIPRNFEFMMCELYVPDEYFEITTNVTSDWKSAYNGEIRIKNTSDIVIEDWIIEFDSIHNIDSFYTAEIISHEDNHYVIKNKGYNANIKPGETIILGFNGSPGDASGEIENVKLGHVITNIEYLLRDTDGDGLADFIEYELGTDPYKVDTDGDGIDDYTEIMLGLDPLKVDSDDNGVLDGDEDLDGDGLTVLQELEYGTNNLSEDTDGDGLTDYDEIFIYGTDPLVADTDGDGLRDGDEIKLGLDPLKKDSDGDGIPDNEEKIEQILVEEIECEESGQITQVSVSMKGTGLIDNTTKIENTFGKDVLSSELVGLIGVPVDIESTSSFDTATIKFRYDEGLLGKTNEEDLRIMWYDEENNQYVIMDEETVLNTEENTLEITTNHFSTYLVVDRQMWYDVWSNAITYRRDPDTPSIPVEYFDICYVIDRSGSMSGSRITTAKESISKFIDSMYTHDRGAIVGFASSAYVYSQFTGEKKSLNNALKTIYATGGTSVEAGLVSALDLFDSTETKYVNNIPNTKMILLLCDGDVNYSDSTLKRAKEDGIKIYPVLIGATSGNTKLQHMADYTGGTFYYAATAEEIREAIWGIQEETIGDIDTTDTDGDGLYDIYETAGMMLPNGKHVYTDPFKADTDGDGLTDAEEMGVLTRFDEQPILKRFALRLAGFDSTIYAEYFDYKSDPTKKDTDGDGIIDIEDPYPLFANCGGKDSNNYKHHNLELCNDGYYHCTRCPYKKKSPQIQDDSILDTHDLNILNALNIMYVYYLGLRCEERGYYGVPCKNELLILNEISRIRKQDKYRGLYDFSDKDGTCIQETYDVTGCVYLSTHTIDWGSIGLYNGFYKSAVGLLVPALIPDMGVIISLIGLGVDDEISIVSGTELLLEFIGKKYDVSVLATSLSLYSLSDDIMSNKVKRGDYEYRICLHRGGYSGLARQSVVTFVFNQDGNPIYIEYAEYGYGDKLEIEGQY